MSDDSTGTDLTPQNGTGKDAARNKRVVRQRRRLARRGVTAVDRANRVVLALIGLALIAAGASGLLAAEGPLDLRDPSTLRDDLVDATAQPEWAWATGAIVILVVLAIALLWWAWTQVRLRRPGLNLSDIRLRSPGRSRTTVASRPVAAAMAHDLEAIEHVTSASVRLVGLRPRPDVVAGIALDRSAPVEQIRTETEAVWARGAELLGADDLDVEVRFRISTRDEQRVH